MASVVLYDRIKETSSTTGTGAYDLGGAEVGFEALSARYSTGDEVAYCAVLGSEWEVGIGTFTSGTPDTLSRDSILSSSSSDLAVNWPSGSKTIYVTLPAKQLQHISFGFSDATITPASSTGTDSIAVGVDTTASGNDAVAIGSHSSATGLWSVSIANGDATADYAIGMGFTAAAQGVDSVAIGHDATASQTNCVAIGEDADATGLNSIHISSGGTASAAGEKGVSIGNGTEAEGLASVGIGDGSQGWNDYSVAIGSGSNCYGDGGVAVGYQLTVNEQYSAAFGTKFHNYVPGSQSFGIESDSGWYDVCVEAETTDGTATDMTTKAGASIVIDKFGNDRTWAFKGIICARQTAAPSAGSVGDSAMFEIDGLINLIGATTTLIGNTAPAATHNTAAFGGSVAVSADDTSEALVITVTGEAGKDIHWTGKVTLVEAS